MLLWVGAAIFFLTVLNSLVGLLTAETFAQHLLVTVVVWIGAFLISRPAFPSQWAATVTAFCTLTVLIEFQYEFWANPTALGFGYVLMIMIAGSPLVLSPMALAYVQAIAVIGAMVIVRDAPESVLRPATNGDWVIAAVTAAITGFILLFQRLRSIDELGEVTRDAEVMANTDRLTGLNNRHGMEEAMPQLLERARASGEHVHVSFVDIDWLKTANDVHGHEFGDAVILAVANAVSASLCANEHAVARWGGDEFLVMGIGNDTDEQDLGTRILEHIRTYSALDLVRWPGSVSTGSASGPAASVSLADLIDEADARMYANRRAKRATP